MKNVIFFLSIFLFFSCSKKEDAIFKEMKSDLLLSKSFTDSELKDLAKIVGFFESQICNENQKEIEKCYNSFLKNDSIRYVDKHEMYVFEYKKQEQLYSDLSPDFFNEFWNEGTGTQFSGNENEVKYTYFNLKVYGKKGLSKYGSFVENYSKENKFIKEYFDGIEVSAEFLTPTTPIKLTYNYKRFNKKDIKIRMIYAFHYLNVNEMYMKPLLSKNNKS